MKDEKNWICIAEGRHAECLWVSGGCKHQGREWPMEEHEGGSGAKDMPFCIRKYSRGKHWKIDLGQTAKLLSPYILEQQWSLRIFLMVGVDLFETSTEKSFPVVKKGKRKQRIFPMIQKKRQIYYGEKAVVERCHGLIPSPLLFQVS